MNAVRDTGVPESSVLGSTDMHEEKSMNSVIQHICMLRGNGASERCRVSETRDGYSTQSTVKKRSDRSVTNQSEAISGLCKLVLLR